MAKDPCVSERLDKFTTLSMNMGDRIPKDREASRFLACLKDMHTKFIPPLPMRILTVKPQQPLSIQSSIPRQAPDALSPVVTTTILVDRSVIQTHPMKINPLTIDPPAKKKKGQPFSPSEIDEKQENKNTRPY